MIDKITIDQNVKKNKGKDLLIPLPRRYAKSLPPPVIFGR